MKKIKIEPSKAHWRQDWQVKQCAILPSIIVSTQTHCYGYLNWAIHFAWLFWGWGVVVYEVTNDD